MSGVKRVIESVDSSSKKLKNTQKFKDTYAKEFPCLTKSNISENMAFCTYCSRDFTISHGGRDDCRRHVLSKMHEKYALSVNKTKAVSDYFRVKDDLGPINAECLFARFLVEHNLPISASDHAKQLFKKMSPDSKIAEKFSSGHTKTGTIIKNMSEATGNKLIEIISGNHPYSISTDGSNDCHDKKLYPLLITYFDVEYKVIMTKLLSLLDSSDNTGEGIFNAIISNMQKKGLKLSNCASFFSDNANTMLGKKKGVAAFILQQNPNLIIRGCPCDLIHIAAKKGASEFDNNVEMLLVEIFYFLDRSSKRKYNFRLLQEICGQGIKPHKILKYTSTRWLSLLESANRVLEQWEPLNCFFSDNTSEDAKNKHFHSVKVLLEDPATKLSFLFFKNSLPVFNKIITILQQDAPYIHRLNSILEQLYTDLLVRFIKPSEILESHSEFDITKIKFDKKSKQKDDDALVIGVDTRMYLNEINNPEVSDKVYKRVRNFYSVACLYMLKKVLICDEFVKNAEVADITKRKAAKFSSVLFMANRFSFLIPKSELGKLEEEFASYQCDNLKEIEDIERMDTVWDMISKIKDCTGGLKYKILPKIMLAILAVPHSNAASERIFSVVRKNQTDFRPNLCLQTLEALLIEKVDMISSRQCCYHKTFTESELKSAKKSTMHTLKGDT